MTNYDIHDKTTGEHVVCDRYEIAETLLSMMPGADDDTQDACVGALAENVLAGRPYEACEAYLAVSVWKV